MTSNIPTPDLDEAVQRVKALSDQVTEQAKKNGLAWIEGYERMLTSLLELQQQAAKHRCRLGDHPRHHAGELRA